MLINHALICSDHAAYDMDSFELFRKLGAGAKFDFKRFGQDAARFKVNKYITHITDNVQYQNGDRLQQRESQFHTFN